MGDPHCPADGVPETSWIPTPEENETGAVVWHREHLRTRDHPALAAAARKADTVLPLFVFDPQFYGADGLACDARIRFLHECLDDLDDRYRERSTTGTGLTLAHGDPVAILEGFDDVGWEVMAARSPTGRYGLKRDERARERANVLFVSGDGIVRDVDRPRKHWQERVTEWFEDDPYEWDPADVRVASAPTDVTIAGVESRYDTDPTKEMVPEGGRSAGRETLRTFVDRLHSYPSNVSAPLDAREGTSGLSPYLRFGCLSVREVYKHVEARGPERGGGVVGGVCWIAHGRRSGRGPVTVPARGDGRHAVSRRGGRTTSPREPPRVRR
jgi:deoxyribodipyrimidine photo-lyase